MTEITLIRVLWDGRQYNATINDVKVVIWLVTVVSTGEEKYVIAKNVHHLAKVDNPGYYVEPRHLLNKPR